MNVNMKQISLSKAKIVLLSKQDRITFAFFCVKQMKVPNKEWGDCVRVIERWLAGDATVGECKLAATAAGVYYITNYPISKVTGGIHNCSTRLCEFIMLEASMVSPSVAIKVEEYLHELVHINEIIEQELLGGDQTCELK